MQSAGFLYAIGAAIAWGLVYTLDQKILENFSPISLLCINAVITLIVTLPIILLGGGTKIVAIYPFSSTFYLIVGSQLLALIASFFILSGIKILGAPTASVFEIMYPFFVIIFSYAIFGADLNLAFWIGSALLFMGSCIIVAFA